MESEDVTKLANDINQKLSVHCNGFDGGVPNKQPFIIGKNTVDQYQDRIN